MMRRLCDLVLCAIVVYAMHAVTAQTTPDYDVIKNPFEVVHYIKSSLWPSAYGRDDDVAVLVAVPHGRYAQRVPDDEYDVISKMSHGTGDILQHAHQLVVRVRDANTGGDTAANSLSSDAIADLVKTLYDSQAARLLLASGADVYVYSVYVASELSAAHLLNLTVGTEFDGTLRPKQLFYCFENAHDNELFSQISAGQVEVNSSKLSMAQEVLTKISNESNFYTAAYSQPDDFWTRYYEKLQAVTAVLRRDHDACK